MANLFSTFVFLCALPACCKELPQVHRHPGVVTQPVQTSATSSPMDVAQLNRHIFSGNVLQPLGGGVERWVVLFCPKWYQPCQKLEPLYAELARTWQHQKNADSSFLRLRFAQVDCAVDKTLCNQQRVSTYPFVAIYSAGQQLHTRGLNWKEDMRKQMEQFLKKLAFPAREAPSESVLPKFLEDFYHHRAMDVVLTLAALAVSAQFMRSNSQFFPQADAARGPTVSQPFLPKIIEL
eukprot:Skav228653  [mRNA]  locus=scaffold2369:101852:105965:+ [translate_table: standard]